MSGWLLDPANPSSCYQDLLNKYCKRPRTTPALGVKKNFWIQVGKWNRKIYLLSTHCPFFLSMLLPAYSLIVCLCHSQVSQVISGLCSLYWLNMELGSKLQVSWRAHVDIGTNSIDTLPDLAVCVYRARGCGICTQTWSWTWSLYWQVRSWGIAKYSRIIKIFWYLVHIWCLFRFWNLFRATYIEFYISLFFSLNIKSDFFLN